ncbi:hypothetical protein L2E82_17191 [Cichorium intybus]|uniref:Uncharacterized protein n=1 Tax=Cichorium intybus TaxID=13427 RepID=A0ACB9F893_CICIN|nr:hypothetical protein L2E82_17191 [Cichorium intybus]
MSMLIMVDVNISIQSLDCDMEVHSWKITSVHMREVRYLDFAEQARIRMYFPKKGSQLTPPHSSIDFYWKDYCSIFRSTLFLRNLREIFKLDVVDYMISIFGDDGFRELSSPGKGGRLFYISHDEDL